MIFTFRFFIFILLLSGLTYNAAGQSFTEIDLFGKWKVVNVIISKVPKGRSSEFEKQKMIFLKSTFRFDPNRTFVYSIENEEEDPEIEKMEIYGAHWRFDQSNGMISITELKEKDSDKFDLMEIKIKIEDQKKYFIISDTNFKLEVEKI